MTNEIKKNTNDVIGATASMFTSFIRSANPRSLPQKTCLFFDNQTAVNASMKMQNGEALEAKTNGSSETLDRLVMSSK